MRRRINAALIACGALVGGLVGVAPAQAADTAQVSQTAEARQLFQAASVSQTVKKIPFSPSARSKPVQISSLNCSAGTFNYDGYQWYFNIACSPISPTTVWLAYITCNNQNTYTSNLLYSYWNVSVYCPPGTIPVEAGVAWA
ncbi:hypothetical protein [Micromonospora cathayae]|uniref:Ig-like domain-containing protein n=1 Tax=Micromonospora cathayae TaxID=3028804 RepID=A0ABY7ZNS1_9ACTN|nr:hypothetical protein [Micromonospora sp. HUAS 3]WDZ83544.1 hypothetical protein PVK37_24225 [Micromonospora sp. HUAS 3]